ncbi:fimbrial protein [Pyxidicoccus xibeiensis]|uniref:fimbrial protein n=1 Tax=Pyxidicoccus xibeiensis TaxID=2906759 RepID=UPI0020A7051F|nr:fimbrial protein [Pyxidicoccus xibeiensis]MCP3144115.1 fimbrial protein [Pyxidicoccus xibeiensis]
MATMKCPKCGRALDVTGLAPGSGLTCACGNVTTVQAGGTSRKTLYIILGVVGVLLLCPCVGIVSAVAIPNFLKFQARAKQAECKMYLKGWYAAQASQYSSAQTYEPVFSKVGFAPERGNRYAYFAGEGPMEARTQAQAEAAEGAVAVGVDTFKFATQGPISLSDLPPDVSAQVGLSGECPECAITAACAGNVDNDETLDVWVVSTRALDLQDEDGNPVAAGQVVNVVNDVNN